jgi:hypothetical protein
MRLLLASLLLASVAQPAVAREAVHASPPHRLAVTMYRDPERGPNQKLDREWPRGFAMISETRTVTLPPGESTIRFEGVAEGMVAVTAIVTGLPGGTIEKNRNADLLSPAALVDGSLGNRVTVTRTNPETGRETIEEAVVRTRADGGVVLQTGAGYEAVRCSGLPERLTFDRVTEGLSAQPVYSVDTVSPAGGTHTVTLTYLAWGFDWQANYVATLAEGGSPSDVRMRLTSWLTLVNDNGQSFPDAELMAVAGRLRVQSDYKQLSDPPEGRPLQLMCYPIGSTAAGSPEEAFMPIPPAPLPPPMAAPVMMDAASEAIMVTGSRVRAPAMIARQEDLADLKLYRVPEPVNVAAKSQKQIAFLDREAVKGRLIYRAECNPWSAAEEPDPRPAEVLLATVNDEKHGLGVALPMGGLTVFESSPRGDQLVGRKTMRDYASGQDVEIAFGSSAQVHGTCERDSPKGGDPDIGKSAMSLKLDNANPSAVTVRVVVGGAGDTRVKGLPGLRVKDGAQIAEISVPANSSRKLPWIYQP